MDKASTGDHGTVLAVSVRTGQGLPCARQRWLAPTDPLQGTAESSSHLGRNSGKLYLRKGKKCQMDRENGNKKKENGRGKPSGRQKPLGTDRGQLTSNPLALQGW